MITGNVLVDLALAVFLALLMLLPLKTGVSAGSWLLVKTVWILQWIALWFSALFQAADAFVKTWLDCRQHTAATTESAATLDEIAAASAAAAEARREAAEAERPTRPVKVSKEPFTWRAEDIRGRD